MIVVILGSNSIGSTLAHKLSSESNDVTVIDHNYDELKQLREKIDIKTHFGNPSYPNILREAGCDQADVLIAVTGSDEINMIACQIGYSLFNIKVKIAKISSPHYLIREELFNNDNLPIDVFINTEELITQELLNLIKFPGTKECHDFGNGAGKLILVETEKKSAVFGKKIDELLYLIQDIPFKIVSIFRHKKPISIKDTTRLMAGDEVYLLTPTENTQTLLGYFCRQRVNSKNIIIAGGGKIGSHLAQSLEDNYRVTLIEKNKFECRKLSEALANTIVINDDCTDKEILINENIGNTDLFCAMTNDDAVNMISSIQAEKLGAKQTVTMIKHPDYANIIQHEHLSAVVSPDQIAINHILKFFRQNDTLRVYMLQNGAIEISEVNVKNTALINQSIGDINLPKHCQIIGIVRQNKLLITSLASRIKNKDQLVIFLSGRGNIHDIKYLF